jgi:hypothetical protein
MRWTCSAGFNWPVRKLIGGTAALCAMAIGAGSAEAAPLHASFDDAALHVAAQNTDLLEPPYQATLQGTEDAGAVSIPSPSGINFPTSSGTLYGFSVAISFEATGSQAITGTLGAGGELSLSSHSYRATVALIGGPTCTYDADLAFSTATPSGGPFNGDPFTVGPPDTTLTQGVLETHWSSLPPAPQPGCESTFNPLTGGAGGFALAHGINLPGTPLGALPPPLAAGPTGQRAAALKKCKKIKKKKKRIKCKKRARKLPV